MVSILSYMDVSKLDTPQKRPLKTFHLWGFTVEISLFSQWREKRWTVIYQERYTRRIRVWYIYPHSPWNQPNVGKYAIHGSYGMYNDFGSQAQMYNKPRQEKLYRAVSFKSLEANFLDQPNLSHNLLDQPYFPLNPGCLIGILITYILQ